MREGGSNNYASPRAKEFLLLAFLHGALFYFLHFCMGPFFTSCIFAWGPFLLLAFLHGALFYFLHFCMGPFFTSCIFAWRQKNYITSLLCVLLLTLTHCVPNCTDDGVSGGTVGRGI